MKKSLLFFLLFTIVSSKIMGQDAVTIQDSVTTLATKEKREVSARDSSKWIKDEKINLTKNQLNIKPEFKPDSKKAIIYSAIFPGLGQIYNRKYWKLPLIYGGLLGLSYGFTWNGQYYNDYKKAYSGIAAEDPRATFNKWKDMANQSNVSDPYTISDSQIQYYKDGFKRKKDYYRRNRDLCIIGVVAIYALSMIDAYVDAHLFDFNISPDLSLKVEPTVMGSVLNTNDNKSFGVQCSVKF